MSIFYVLCIVLIGYVSCSTVHRTKSNETIQQERNLDRTRQLIQQSSEGGRIVLLSCKKRRNCQRSRSNVPLWIREFNEQNGYIGEEFIHYHFTVMAAHQTLPFLNDTEIHFPLLVYYIAHKAHVFDGSVTDKSSVIRWLQQLDEVTVQKPTTESEVTQLFELASTENCTDSKYLIVVNDDKRCHYESWKITARVVWREFGIRSVRIAAPLSSEIAVVLKRRLPDINSAYCINMFLLAGDIYSLTLDETSPPLVAELISHLLPDGDACEPLDALTWQHVRPALTELQLLYWSGEHDLQKLEHNLSYIVVGIVGGGAVCTLAVSIFWGLNGSAFTK